MVVEGLQLLLEVVQLDVDLQLLALVGAVHRGRQEFDHRVVLLVGLLVSDSTAHTHTKEPLTPPAVLTCVGACSPPPLVSGDSAAATAVEPTLFYCSGA